MAWCEEPTPNADSAPDAILPEVVVWSNFYYITTALLTFLFLLSSERDSGELGSRTSLLELKLQRDTTFCRAEENFSNQILVALERNLELTYSNPTFFRLKTKNENKQLRSRKAWWVDQNPVVSKMTVGKSSTLVEPKIAHLLERLLQLWEKLKITFVQYIVYCLTLDTYEAPNECDFYYL